MFEEGIGRPREALLSVAAPGSGQSIFLSGDVFTTKLVGAQTGGRSNVSEITVLPQGGPRLHRHMQFETLYVLDGTVEFTGAKRGKFHTYIGGPGALFHVPGCVPHAYYNAGESPARLLSFNGPAGLESYLAAAGNCVEGVREALGLTIDHEKLIGAGLNHGIEPIDPELFDSREGYRATGVQFLERERLPVAGVGFMGSFLRFLTRTENTEFGLTLVEVTRQSDHWSIMRSHASSAVFYVLDGQFEFCVQLPSGMQVLPAGVGATVHVPGDMPYTLRNTNAAPSRMMAYFSPAGIEDVVEKLGVLADDQHTYFAQPPLAPSSTEWQRMVDTAMRHGFVIHGDPPTG